MADLRFEDPRTTEQFCSMIERDGGIKLPLSISQDDIGSVLDANGREILTVDVNRALTDDQVDRIAHWIVLAVNTCGGFQLEVA